METQSGFITRIWLATKSSGDPPPLWFAGYPAQYWSDAQSFAAFQSTKGKKSATAIRAPKSVQRVKSRRRSRVSSKPATSAKPQKRMVSFSE